MAQAQHMIEKYEDALVTIKQCLEQDPKNKEIIKLRDTVTTEFNKKKEQERKEKEEEVFTNSEINLLCLKNKIKLVNRTIDFPAA